VNLGENVLEIFKAMGTRLQPDLIDVLGDKADIRVA